MALVNCNCKSNCSCVLIAVISSVIIGIVAAFLQITGVIPVTAAFLWVLLGIAIVYLGVLVIAFALKRGENSCNCLCSAINTALIGILGTILFSVILLAIGAVAASALSAILVGLVILFFWLTVSSSACIVRCLAECGD